MSSDKKILEKYIKGAPISKTDKEVLERYASTGMVSFSFNYKTKNTSQGRWLLKQF